MAEGAKSEILEVIGGAGEAMASPPKPQEASIEATPSPQKGAGHKAALVARRREALKRQIEEKRTIEDATTERWSGLRIANRCVRQEKWDFSMRGKDLVPFHRLGGLSATGQDRVIIGVLASPPSGPILSARGEREAQWKLTDLNQSNPQQASLILVGRALEHWACAEGAGWRHASIGSILGVLNPAPAGQGKVRVCFETQVLKLGSCPSLAFCPALGSEGRPCREVYNSEGGQGYCAYHARQSHYERAAAPQRPRRGVAAPPPLRLAASPARALAPKQLAPPPAEKSGPVAKATAAEQGQAEAELIAEALLAEAEELIAAAVATGAATAPSTAELLQALQHLESAAINAEFLCGTSLYSSLGALASRPGSVGDAAKRVRRRWRVLLDALGPAPLQQDASVAKRQRLAETTGGVLK